VRGKPKTGRCMCPHGLSCRRAVRVKMGWRQWGHADHVRQGGPQAEQRKDRARQYGWGLAIGDACPRHDVGTSSLGFMGDSDTRSWVHGCFGHKEACQGKTRPLRFSGNANGTQPSVFQESMSTAWRLPQAAGLTGVGA
jgi:hypothetical protein